MCAMLSEQPSKPETHRRLELGRSRGKIVLEVAA
jgi:hypothetical protein